jgi:hypothetical protein
MSEAVLGYLERAFVEHGISARRDGPAVIAGETIVLTADSHAQSRSDHNVVIQLDITSRTAALGETPLIDSFGGIGDDFEEAVRNAFSKFLLGSFHVLAEALIDHQCDETQVEWLNWSNGKDSWRVCCGPILTQATGQATLSPGFEGYLTKLESAFAASAAPGPHWLRIFVGYLDGKMIGSEVVMDGEDWTLAQDLMARHDWAPGDRYQTLRNLIIALPGEEKRPSTGRLGSWLARAFGRPQ